jgi:dihydropteroate synthase
VEKGTLTMQHEIRTRIMAIVNLTPDSFSDGGKYVGADAAIAYMEQLVEQGADILDIGAESTRPGARCLSVEEEWERLEPVLAIAKNRFSYTPISVDTRHANTAARAIDAGADWINDVNGGQDPQMLAVIRAASCNYVMMHSLSVPADPKNVLPEGVDAATTIRSWAERRTQELYDQGIAPERIILDPGIGFGKTAEQSWRILQAAPNLLDLPFCWLIGHSRKSFFKLITEKDAMERDTETHMVSAWLARHSVPYLRVHDVPGTKRAIAVGMQLREGKTP